MKIVTEEAQPIAELRKSVPTNVAAAVAQALEKLPADRFGSAADFASALGDTSFRSTSVMGKETAAPATSGVSSAGVRWRPWVIAAIALVAGLAVGRTFVSQGDDHRTYRFTLRTEGFTNSGMDIASDGSFIVYGASDTLGINRLFIRRFDELESRPLPGTEGARSPSLSPDDQQIAYVINRATTSRFGIRRVSVAGTPPVEVSPIEALGVTWGIDDYLYFAHPVLGTTARIPAGGGEVEIMAEREDTAAYRTRTHLWHDVLPGGQAVVFTIVYIDESQNEVAVLDLETQEVSVLTRGMSPKYIASGDLIYSSVDGTLFRHPFDAKSRKFTGPAQSVVSGLWVPGFGFANALVSDNGTLVYQPSVATATAFGRTLTGYAPDAAEFGRRISLVDREGIERTLPFPRQSYNNVVVSPDGTRLALEILEGAADGGDLLIAGIDDTVPTVFTSEGIDTYPVWTPDGTRIAFSRFAAGTRDFYWKPADGSGRAEPIFEQEGAEFEIQFTPNQDAIVYRFGNASVGDDLALRVWRFGETEHSTFLDMPGSAERAHQLSPDGRWVAYVANQTGADQVYVRPFPDDGTGAVHPISIEGGSEPAWNPAGGELFYKERGALFAATVRTSSAFAVTNRTRLFSVADYWNNQNHLRYAVMPDGQSFLMIGVASSSGTGIETVVVTNWLAELAKGR